MDAALISANKRVCSSKGEDMRVMLIIPAIALVLASVSVSGEPITAEPAELEPCEAVCTGSSNSVTRQSVSISGHSQDSTRPSPGSPVRLAHADGIGVVSQSDSEDAPSAPASLEQVVVTAQKYAQPAFNVPISLDVLSGAALQRMGDNSLEQLQFSVPGLTVQSEDIQRRIIIDGVSNTYGLGGLVGEYIDDADATSSPSLYAYNALDIRTYDLARVEVLRGPQGTLYGEGAVGGAIHFVTNAPVVDAVQLGLRSETFFTKGGQPSEHIFPVVNIPLVGQRLALRISGEYDHDGGWINLPSASQTDINQDNLSDTRIQALWQASDRFQASVLEIIHRKSVVNAQGENAAGDLVQAFNLATVPSGRDRYNLSAITLQYDLAQAGKLLSATTYYHDDNEALLTATPPILGPPPAPVLEIVAHPNDYIYGALTEELRLTQAALGPWTWTVGGIYKRVRTNNLPTGDIIGVQGLSPTGVTLQQLLSESGLPFSPIGEYDSSNSSAEFGDVSYRMTDRMSVGAGVRHFRDNRTTWGVNAPFQEGTFTSTDPRVYALFRANGVLNLYANAAKGFRSGGFNSVGNPPFAPESLWHYELGAKTREVKGISGTADIYYSNYSNYQTEGLIYSNGILTGITLNGGTVHIKGVEGSLVWSPLEDWTIRLGANYVDARFVRVPAAGATHTVGDPVDEVPRYQANGSLERDFRIFQRRAFVRADYMQRAKQYYRNRSIGSWYYAYSAEQYFLSLEAGLQWSDALSVGVLGRNLLNDRGSVDPFVNETGPLRPRPLTLGFYFDARFE